MSGNFSDLPSRVGYIIPLYAIGLACYVPGGIWWAGYLWFLGIAFVLETIYRIHVNGLEAPREELNFPWFPVLLRQWVLIALMVAMAWGLREMYDMRDEPFGYATLWVLMMVA